MAEFILHDIDISGLIKAKFMLDNAIKIAKSPLEKLGQFNVLNTVTKFPGR